MSTFRSYGPRFDWKHYFPPAIRMIIVICAGVFALQELSGMFGEARGWNFWLLYLGPFEREAELFPDGDGAEPQKLDDPVRRGW